MSREAAWETAWNPSIPLSRKDVLSIGSSAAAAFLIRGSAAITFDGTGVGKQWICGYKVVLFLAHKEAKLSWNRGYLDDKKVVKIVMTSLIIV